MLAEELIGRADRTARQMFEEHGRLPDALVWIYTKGRMIAVPCKPRGPDAEMRAKGVACALIRASRKKGDFEGVVLVAEAWMSLCPGGREPELRPAFDPNRIEVVILMAYGDDGRNAAQARRIVTRSGRRALGELVEPFQKLGMTYQSWMDAAFKEPTDARNGN